jgi:tetratricopeptide (TPR) repeat protein
MIEKLVEQWNAARSSLESARQAAEMADLRQAERLDVHVNRMEERLAAQRKENEDILRAIQNANSDNLRYAGLFVGLGLFAVFMLSLLQWRATLKLTQMVLRPYPSSPAQLPPISSAESSEPPVATNKETIRLIESLDRMEQRIRELESAASVGKSRPRSISRVVEAETRADALARPTDEPSGSIIASPVASPSKTSKAVASSQDAASFYHDETPKTSKSVVGGILGKGEALLQLGQSAEALIAFEETLRLDPYLVEAWVKKGSALERLERMEEALACYDKAIELDKSFTLAYLYKGGVCNRLERFDEALACYEQALRSHETATTNI